MKIKMLSWGQKVYTIPKLPRGDKGATHSLLTIFQMINNQEDPKNTLPIPGSTSNMSLNEACINLRPLNIVDKKPLSKWKINIEIESYSKDETIDIIINIFSSRVKYFNEALSLVLHKLRLSIAKFQNVPISHFQYKKIPL